MAWEYIILRIDGFVQDRAAMLDNYGAKGWELVGVVYDSTSAMFEYTFKRELSGHIAYDR